MKKSDMIEILRQNKLYNSYDLLNAGEYILSYKSRNRRDCLGSNWCLHRKGYKFKDAAWYEHDGKYFRVMGREDKKEVLEKALKFVKDRSNNALVKGIFGDYISESANNRMLELTSKEVKVEKI